MKTYIKIRYAKMFGKKRSIQNIQILYTDVGNKTKNVQNKQALFISRSYSCIMSIKCEVR